MSNWLKIQREAGRNASVERLTASSPLADALKILNRPAWAWEPLRHRQDILWGRENLETFVADEHRPDLVVGLGLFTRKIVGWAMRHYARTELAISRVSRNATF